MVALSIVAAQELDQALALLSARPRHAVKAHLTEEPEAAGAFLYDFRTAFAHYEYYYQLDPYRVIVLGADQVPNIRAFADSVLTWLSAHGAEENRVIQRYGISFRKLRDFAVALGRVCNTAMEHGCGVIGIGD